MDCFRDFCLACDRESTTGPYCSQTCRLADLEKASDPSTPASLSSSSAYVLPPAYDFSHRPAIYSRCSEPSRQASAYLAQSPARPAPAQRSLTPSSSRSSLSSTNGSSSPSSGGLTDQARQELQDYYSSFDQARAARRRSSVK